MAAGYRWRRGLAAIAAGIITLTACGGGDSAPTREYTLHLRTEDDQDDYTYIAEDPVDDLRAGDRVTIEMNNTGSLRHDLQVVAPDGSVLAKADPVAPGQILTLLVDFPEPGFYRLNCLIDNHLTEHNMQVVVEVKDEIPSGS